MDVPALYAGSIKDVLVAVGDRVNEGSALAAMASASYWAHDFDVALEYSRGAIEVATLADAKQVLAASYFTAGTVHAITGRLNQAEEELTCSFSVAPMTR